MRARLRRAAVVVPVVAAATAAIALGVVTARGWPGADDGTAARQHLPASAPGPASPDAAVAPGYSPPTGPAPRRSGPLSSADVPAPSILGQGFRTYADPGGAEAGWIGNGTFVRGRDAHEAAFGVLPLGCKHRLDVSLPVPVHALQASYHGPRASPAQVVVLGFGSQADAAGYFGGFTAMLAHCRAPDGPSGVVAHVTSRAATSYVGTRTYLPRELWSEVDVRSGKRVAVLLSSIPVQEAQTVAADLRRAVAAR